MSTLKDYLSLIIWILKYVFLILGLSVLLLQCVIYLDSGDWFPTHVLNAVDLFDMFKEEFLSNKSRIVRFVNFFITESFRGWVHEPEKWIGLHKLLVKLPLSVTLLVLAYIMNLIDNWID